MYLNNTREERTHLAFRAHNIRIRYIYTYYSIRRIYNNITYIRFRTVDPARALHRIYDARAIRSDLYAGKRRKVPNAAGGPLHRAAG